MQHLSSITDRNIVDRKISKAVNNLKSTICQIGVIDTLTTLNPKQQYAIVQAHVKNSDYYSPLHISQI